MKLLPYEPAHMDLFEQRDVDVQRYGKITSETPNPIAEHGVCFTLVNSGRILVVGGIFQASKHTGACFTFVSKYAEGRSISVLRTIKRQLEQMMQDMRIHRVETSNLIHAHDHHKWCRLLGFQEEGVMRYYDDKKQDYIRFAKYQEF